jgi:hypothetical protein
MMKKGERKVLDYGDVLLREADVALLEGPHWLNDQVSSTRRGSWIVVRSWWYRRGLELREPGHRMGRVGR